MKLARPDIRHPRIVLAGAPRPGGAGDHDDDAGLVPALRRRGLHAHWTSWDDPETLRADLVILRSVGDLRERLDDFLAWTKRVPKLLNAPDVIAWNIDSGYLRDLDNAGVPIAPGGAVGSGEEQPSDTVLVFLGGAQSHAFTTGPRPREAEPDFELWDVGQAALQAAADQLGIRVGELLCARAEVTGDAADARLLSLDLVAPSLGWSYLDEPARDAGLRRFALCVESALKRLGLGPLSRRRP